MGKRKEAAPGRVGLGRHIESEGAPAFVCWASRSLYLLLLRNSLFLTTGDVKKEWTNLDRFRRGASGLSKFDLRVQVVAGVARLP
jgi:hypothetical protein